MIVLFALLIGFCLVSGVGACGNIGFLVEIICYTFLYSIGIYTFAMNGGEREKVRKLSCRMRVGRCLVMCLDRFEECMMQSNIGEQLKIREWRARSQRLLQKFMRHLHFLRKDK